MNNIILLLHIVQTIKQGVNMNLKNKLLDLGIFEEYSTGKFSEYVREFKSNAGWSALILDLENGGYLQIQTKKGNSEITEEDFIVEIKDKDEKTILKFEGINVLL